MPMWEYEEFMKELNEIVKKENKEQQSEMDKYHVGELSKMTDPKRLHQMTNPKMPEVKMPSMGSIKI